MRFRKIAGAVAMCVVLMGSAFAASSNQVGTFTGTLKVKGVHPVTGAKITTKSVVLLSVATDNSTTLTIDGVDYLGQPDNTFGPTFASIVVSGPGPTIATAALTFKNTSIKGTFQSTTFAVPSVFSSGKMKLKSTSTTLPPGFGSQLPNGSFVSSTNVPLNIPDPGYTTSTLYLAPIGFISDVNVGFSITHTFTSDCFVSLISPSGTEVFLILGWGDDNFTGTILDDEASTHIVAGTQPFTGSFIPFNPLSAFDGEPAGGTWRLVVNDLIPFDTGTLDSWSLQVTTTLLP